MFEICQVMPYCFCLGLGDINNLKLVLGSGKTKQRYKIIKELNCTAIVSIFCLHSSGPESAPLIFFTACLLLSSVEIILLS